MHPKIGSTLKSRRRVRAAGRPPDEPLRKGETQRLTVHAQITLDATQSSFFPLSTEERTNMRGNVRLKDITDLLREKGLDPRLLGFYRTESSEETAKRREEVKGDLTRDWKKRDREAVKSRRRIRWCRW